MMNREEVQELLQAYEKDRDSIAYGLMVLTMGIKHVPLLLEQNAELKKKLDEKDRLIAELRRELTGFMEKY